MAPGTRERMDSPDDAGGCAVEDSDLVAVPTSQVSQDELSQLGLKQGRADGFLSMYRQIFRLERKLHRAACERIDAVGPYPVGALPNQSCSLRIS